MKCEEFLERMDAFVDGELDEGARLGILEHARECEDCAKELKLNGMLREALLGADADVVLPLRAQASWRAAVAAEARRKRMGSVYRKVGALAAAFAVMIGVAAGLQLLNPKPTESPSPKQAVQDDAEISGFTFVGIDGEDATAQPMMFSAEVATETNASVKLVADDIARAAETIKSLAAEFNGYIGTSSVTATSAYVTAYIPSGELEKFIESLEYVGEVESSRITGEGGETASVTIMVKGE